MKIIMGLLISGVWLVLSGTPAHAAGDWGPCQSDTVHQFVSSFDEKITDPSQNYSGHEFDNFYRWNNGQSYSVTCQCPDDMSNPPPGYYKAEVNLPAGHATNWYKVNDSLEVRTTISVSNEGNINAPFVDLSNNNPTSKECASKGGVHDAQTGTTGSVSLYIAHPFVGTSTIPQTEIAALYVSKKAGVYSTTPLVRIMLSGTIEVEQGCEMDAGSVVNISLGEYDARDFEVPAGSPPKNVQVVNEKLVLRCHNISDGVRGWVHIEGTVNPHNATAIDMGNPDIGVQIAGNESDKVLVPNDTNSEEPIALGFQNSDGSRSAVFNMHAWPISTTGKRPASGNYQGIATMRVEIE
ncbi:hypothetical protein GM31_09715 [Trabulsiella odontotermitis]|uniref:Fimbrial-type adhesion domain-containing protein n=2 Tax=Trabulsiella odontotermitis TaxID=379893 RepID=A0A0L0GH54_9ENTR|nr:hypothetical protein GM30_12645 [Trabulsiella odontotermitis]KNC94928.1 hypothetical protein GM31_09715 [Trabulsiella odontotermitis]